MILETMLQRLFASLVHGPSMNARPHRSRQRCDWMELGLLKGVEPASALKALLESSKLEFPAKVSSFSAPSYPEAEWSDSQKQARDAHQKQTKLLKKLRDIADDALEYMNDHGESCLAVGFPLVSLPATAEEKAARGSSRVLAPLLLMPVNIQVRTASRAGVTIECAASGADMLVANPALMAWLERQTGKALGEVFADETASDPWREVAELLKQVTGMLDLTDPPAFGAESLLEAVPALEKLPKTASIVPSAVLGLFPLSNQSLLRDTRWMLENQQTLKEPVSAFLNPEALHHKDEDQASDAPVNVQRREFSGEWLVSNADPCQANAVLSAREARALVVHGPPGTGKSQTITNMIADHLARGERILFVCDKRTALDVVKYRLDAVGLGDLCGVVHDPSSDRKDFYMGLRGKLENLADAPPIADPRPRLETVNRQLAAIHAELDGYRRKIHLSGQDGAESFHALLGSWLGEAQHAELPLLKPLPSLTPASVDALSTTLNEVCRRAEKAGYAVNPFRGLLGMTLADFMARSGTDMQLTLEALTAAAEKADAERPASLTSQIKDSQSLTEQAAQCDALAAQVLDIASAHEKLSATSAVLVTTTEKTEFRLRESPFLGMALRCPPTLREDLRHAQPSLETWLAEVQSAQLDAAHAACARAAGIHGLARVNPHLTALTTWKALAGSFFKRLFAFAEKKAATAALSLLGLDLASGVDAGLAYYRGLQARLLLQEWLCRFTDIAPHAAFADAELQVLVRMTLQVWDASDKAGEMGCNALFVDTARLKEAAEALQAEARWLRALDLPLTLAGQSGIFTAGAVSLLRSRWLGDTPAAQTTRAWQAQASSMEDMLRVRHALGQQEPALAGAMDELLVQGSTFEQGHAALHRLAVENALRARLQLDPELAAIDGERIEAAFDNFMRLSQEKPALVADYIRYLWQHHQKSRLLAGTGTQLNKLGSGLRQRLYVKGKKALKLRQMLATGADIEGGDPIYDLCPVWMASPSTVAQIFPRHAIFNVVIFDEASQCRLEEALPVLMRGERVVIAGDQKQLPPTRFFESALTDSGDSDAETAEELFFQQQSDAEDLLTAALNLDVREAYLDVHYRSRNEALIGFSNEHYYGSRLQPIPGHPRNKALNTPIRLHRVDGVYHERANEEEAVEAVNLVATLLAEAEPPSIGIACFNLTQKEAIHDAIAARIEKDADFARRYETAKNRKGRDSFEGIFVKNLENVQGDERDVMIICTTFGPDPQGKFRRNFGALSQREGGRRLNVLVTRARDAVHVLTSIPAAEYASVEPVPPGQVPNGRLQLYAYLRYAEHLADFYESYHDELEKMRRDAKPEMKTWDNATPSPLALALGRTLLERHQTGSHIHWGNEGFCVDVACIHPIMPADVTVGVLTDFSRFHKTPDPIEWDIFRTRVLRAQGWELERLWSPVLFRRSEELLARVKAAHDRLSTPPAVRELMPDTPAS